MLSIYLGDSVVSTQPRTIIKDIRLKFKYNKNKVCVLQLLCGNLVVKLVSKQKLSLFSVALNSHTEGSFSLNWAIIAPTELCVTYLSSECSS